MSDLLETRLQTKQTNTVFFNKTLISGIIAKTSVDILRCETLSEWVDA